MKRITLLLSLLSAWTATTSAATLYEQPANSGWPGHYSNAGLLEVADNFTLPGDSTVTAATWYGLYNIDLDPAITSLDFSVAFFDNAGGVPGTELWRQTVSAAVTDIGMTVINPDQPQNGRKIYAFDAGLGPLAASGGVPMWISIMDADADTPQWMWNYSTYPASSHASRILDDGDWVNWPGTLAFTLYGETRVPPAIPAPGAIVLGMFGTSLVGWLGRRRTL